MDLTFSAEERAFEAEVREFIAQHLTPEMKRAQALTTVSVLRPGNRHRVAEIAA